MALLYISSIGFPESLIVTMVLIFWYFSYQSMDWIRNRDHQVSNFLKRSSNYRYWTSPLSKAYIKVDVILYHFKKMSSFITVFDYSYYCICKWIINLINFFIIRPKRVMSMIAWTSIIKQPAFDHPLLKNHKIRVTPSTIINVNYIIVSFFSFYIFISITSEYSYNYRALADEA